MTTPAAPLKNLVHSLRQSKLVRFCDYVEQNFAGVHLKELAFSEVGPHREMRVGDHELIDFSFDSFLGLDQDPRVKEALQRGARQWGTQFGASRAFALCGIEAELEKKIANWLGTEAAVIYPSVTLANVGALPGLVDPPDLIAVDECAHNSIVEGTKIARANGVRVITFQHNDAHSLERELEQAQPYRAAVVAIDGVYSMSGALATMRDLNEVCCRHKAVLYVDDAHATGVLGEHGRGTVLEALGCYDNALVVGCLSKACSVFGAFIGCTAEMQRLLKMRSNTYIFGGPVPPPYLEAISTVLDILSSPGYTTLRSRLDRNVEHMIEGLKQQNLVVLGGQSPIVSVLVGHEDETFRAGKFLFDRGFYVQSVTFPAVAYHAGVLRIQINANHQPEAIDRLLAAISELCEAVEMPRAAAVECASTLA